MSKLISPQGRRRPRPEPGSRLWHPDLRASAGPVYRAIVDTMETDIAAGRLGPGARLPSQRVLARALGVNLTTVTRAMREAERRGLVIGSKGSGTFVASRLDRVPDWRGTDQLPARADFVDLSLNYPPEVAEAELAGALAEWAADIARRPQECRSLLPYRATQGGGLRPCGGGAVARGAGTGRRSGSYRDQQWGTARLGTRPGDARQARRHGAL